MQPVNGRSNVEAISYSGTCFEMKHHHKFRTAVLYSKINHSVCDVLISKEHSEILLLLCVFPKQLNQSCHIFAPTVVSELEPTTTAIISKPDDSQGSIPDQDSPATLADTDTESSNNVRTNKPTNRTNNKQQTLFNIEP